MPPFSSNLTELLSNICAANMNISAAIILNILIKKKFPEGEKAPPSYTLLLV